MMRPAPRLPLPPGGRPAILEARAAGEADTTDLLIGLALALLLPFACYLLSGVILMGGTQTSIKGDRLEKPKVDPAPTAEEVMLRYAACEDLFKRTAKTLLKHAETLSDGFMREDFRVWANRSLKAADASLADLEAFIEKYPESQGKYPSQIAGIAAMRKDIKNDLERAKKLDILGRGDTGR